MYFERLAPSLFKKAYLAFFGNSVYLEALLSEWVLTCTQRGGRSEGRQYGKPNSLKLLLLLLLLLLVLGRPVRVFLRTSSILVFLRF